MGKCGIAGQMGVCYMQYCNKMGVKKRGKIINKNKNDSIHDGMCYPNQPQDAHRVSMVPARYRHTMEPEVVAPEAGELWWRRQLFEAVELVQSELERRFYQEWLGISARLTQQNKHNLTVCTVP